MLSTVVIVADTAAATGMLKAAVHDTIPAGRKVGVLKYLSAVAQKKL
jgi:hypothetical protein